MSPPPSPPKGQMSPNITPPWKYIFCHSSRVVQTFSQYMLPRDDLEPRANSCTVEISKHQWGKVESQWVFGGCCRESGLVFMVPVEKPDKATLSFLIRHWISPGTLIISDECTVFRDIPTIERISWTPLLALIRSESWAFGVLPRTNVKLHVPPTKDYLCGYLAKYMFLRKCRIQKLDPLEEFFKAAGRTTFPLSTGSLDEPHARPINDEDEAVRFNDEDDDD